MYANNDLEQVVKLAKERGYKVYTFHRRNPNITIKQVFIVNQSGKIGSCSEYWGGIRFSTIHKPGRECGTGFIITDDFDEPENMDASFNVAPAWANHYNVQKYRDWEEYTSKESVLTYYEL